MKLRTPKKVDPPPECPHMNAYPIIVDGFPSGRLSDGKTIYCCPDCRKVGADIGPKEENGKT